MGWEDPRQRDRLPTPVFLGFPGGSDGKESACHAGDLGSIPGLGRSPGGRHGNPLQCSSLENPHGHRSLAGCSPWGHKELDYKESCCSKSLPSCLTEQPHSWQPTRLLCPWDSPGKNTGVGCHFLLQCMKVKNESEVAQSCLTLRDPMDCSLPGSSIHGIFQARVLEWVTISFSNKKI